MKGQINQSQFQSPVVILSITQIDIQEDQIQRTKHKDTDEPILCYVYLNDKIQDVRGICRDETRINLNANKSNLDILKQTVLIQVKKGSSLTYGYTKIPIQLINDYQQNHIKAWFPLFKDKEHKSLQFNDLQNLENQNKIYIDINIKEEFQTNHQLNALQAKSSNPFKTSDNSVNYTKQDVILAGNIYDEQNNTYQEISENITLIQGQPFQESQKIIAQSLGQQIFRKKKKTYTQSANPQIQLIPQINNNESKNKQEYITKTPLELEKLLINDNDLQVLESNVDKQLIKQELLSQVDQNIQFLQDQSQLKFNDVTNWYQNVKQISKTEAKDVIINDQRQTLLNGIIKDDKSLINNIKQQENQKQQFQTQIKLLQVHGGIPQKSDKLESLKTIVSQLKLDLSDIENQKSLELNQNDNYDKDTNQQEESKTQSHQINYQKQELQMLLQLSQQNLNTKSLSDSVLEEIDKLKDTFVNEQIDKNQQLFILKEDNESLNNNYLETEIELQQLKCQFVQQNQTKERQELEIELLKKQLQVEQQSLLNYNTKLQELIIKQNQSTSAKKLKLEQITNQIIQNKKELEQLSIMKEQELKFHQDFLQKQVSEDQSFTSLEVSSVQSEIAWLIEQLEVALNENQQSLNEQYHNIQSLNTTVSDSSLTIILESTQDINDKICDKHDLFNTKQQKHEEITSKIENIKDQIEYMEYKSQIYNEFAMKLQNLQNFEKELDQERTKIRNIFEQINQINKDSKEKLDIQENELKKFEQEQLQDSNDQKNLRLKEQQALDKLLSIKTKQDLDYDMNQKLQQIRELESELKGKDYEIDTLEQIQTQKDTIILELEEQAGKFREVIKEVHYELHKHDRVEEALRKFIKQQKNQIEIKKIGDGYYKFGTRRIYIKLDSKDMNTLLVRVAPKEYITLNMFIIENESIEIQKLKGVNSSKRII